MAFFGLPLQELDSCTEGTGIRDRSWEIDQDGLRINQVLLAGPTAVGWAGLAPERRKKNPEFSFVQERVSALRKLFQSIRLHVIEPDWITPDKN
jgi:hypothetical protein